MGGWQPLDCPTDTDYPPDAICGFDFSKLACFSPGESGSPLMLTESTQPREERMHVQAICSRPAKQPEFLLSLSGRQLLVVMLSGSEKTGCRRC